tara:strand:+ start:5195 stop:5506 length:312 start_codon:yes stop_codon:yes gene_type:complete
VEAVRQIQLLPKIIMASAVTLAVVTSVIAGNGPQMINGAIPRSNIRALRWERNAVFGNLKDENAGIIWAMSKSEIGYALGYADASCFDRQYRNWAGRTTVDAR